ncbi:lytic polysaccharide monooxygenase [Legionella bozemanae]|uniref:Chitin-binding protein n=1 Tax=Legionella bozemanae TaxID=447 RepID=A0A0W0RSC9_LEGBO|nr:lytic polysaccharide monooxygenase [Legionella bozemanae]KTC73968.1 chitin-binding protein [Legionella bozemanae]STO33554.1 GlcNAc-binding protein A precursor [Legionella bozemanae]
MKKLWQFLLLNFVSILLSSFVFAHGVIESPASRQQFCGVESKPDEIYKDKMTHEECRPMMTKSDGSLDNSIYNFMAVLTHTTGRSTKPISELPANVCGFNSESWQGGKTPWDRALNWPTVPMSSGQQEFVWNISWGNHFGDTEEFVYWITKPDFRFDPNKELSWDDFETTPFCHLSYNDQNPNANPNVIPDKVNNKFVTLCNVPARESRAVIYGEWGRNKWTYERFHSCIDVSFNDNPPPPVDIKAVIQKLPTQISGAEELELDGSQSIGSDLSYTWSIDADDLSPYTLTNSNSAKAHLSLANLRAQQPVTINLTVTKNDLRSQTSLMFIHSPAITSSWQLVGNAIVSETLKSGDKIQLRLIDNNGKDYFLPSEPLVLDSESAKPENIAYTLAQVINMGNNFSVKIGILDTNGKVEPGRNLNNKIYAPVTSIIKNAYIYVVPSNNPVETCTIERQSGSSAYWMGYNIYVDKAPFILDFSSINIDLTQINVSPGVFSEVSAINNHQLLVKIKPFWVTKTVPGYMGFTPKSGSYPPFDNPLPASCQSDTN